MRKVFNEKLAFVSNSEKAQHTEKSDGNLEGGILHNVTRRSFRRGRT